jgi:hypothetical protein
MNAYLSIKLKLSILTIILGNLSELQKKLRQLLTTQGDIDAILGMKYFNFKKRNNVLTFIIRFQKNLKCPAKCGNS